MLRRLIFGFLALGLLLTVAQASPGVKGLKPRLNGPLQISTTSPLPAATVGSLYSLQFAATGGAGFVQLGREWLAGLVEYELGRSADGNTSGG